MLGGAAGKSSMIEYLTKGTFNEKPNPTIGASFCAWSLIDRSARFEIWDTSSIERYRPIASMYYRGAHVVVIVFDFAQSDSLTQAHGWLKEISENTSDRTIIYLVGNKDDLPKQVQVEEAQNLAAAYKANYRETSAKTGHNIVEIFTEMGRGDIGPKLD
eukprot:TRINITY_DN5599_c0_g1_i2.p1 TRINITY_DN5599_c0_g1~~TRINITY_DN5599_c0_g1_i2.p1  ORF type:complete len:159 (-),score=37.29 TRINITY_DN5599_c0_g1_i2:3-479(-)